MSFRKTAVSPLISTTIFLVFTTAAVLGQSPCADAKHRQFDFWIGEWEVYSGEKLAGTNSIQPILDGCILQETWTGTGGGKGTSLNYYNPDTGKWHQYWVWQSGKTLPLLTGEFENGKMILGAETKAADGKPLRYRITWYHNEDGTVRQHWEASSDNGASWTTQFDGLYRKRKS